MSPFVSDDGDVAGGERLDHVVRERTAHPHDVTSGHRLNHPPSGGQRHHPQAVSGTTSSFVDGVSLIKSKRGKTKASVLTRLFIPNNFFRAKGTSTHSDRPSGTFHLRQKLCALDLVLGLVVSHAWDPCPLAAGSGDAAPAARGRDLPARQHGTRHVPPLPEPLTHQPRHLRLAQPFPER